MTLNLATDWTQLMGFFWTALVLMALWALLSKQGGEVEEDQ
ncbi:hypothetical protein [Kineosporia corallincola]|nr:hypothetical protein [Kineosporia corallincola]